MGTVYLRVDVDFNVGLRKGVPFILDLLESADIKATFFIVMGPDTLWMHRSRMNRKDYRRRFRSYNYFRIVRYFGLAYIKSLLLNRGVGQDFPEMLGNLIRKGHDIGIHGYNHALWAKQGFELSREETIEQMTSAIAIHNKLFFNRNWVWGAPNWRCNAHMFEYLDKKRVMYSSDVRGVGPFYPVVSGHRSSVLQFPINLPCLHELVSFGVPKESIPDLIVQCAKNQYNLWCIHDYYEGILEKGLFSDVLWRFIDEGFSFRPLSHAYENRDKFEISESEIDKVSVPGGIGIVSCQKEFVENNYFRDLDDFVHV